MNAVPKEIKGGVPSSSLMGRYHINGSIERICEICGKSTECFVYEDVLTHENFIECRSCIEKKELKIQGKIK